MRVGRLGLVAVLVVAGMAMTGCRSAPTVAAYLGDRQITIDEVDRIADEPHVAVARHGEVANFVLGAMIIHEIGQRVMTERSLSVPGAVSPQMVADRFGIDADAELAPLLADNENLLNALASTVEPVEPTQAQQRAAYESMYYNGQPVSQGYSFDEIRPMLTRDAIGRTIAVRDLLARAVAESGLVVNPRYSGLQYVLQVDVRGVHTGIVVPLTTSEVPVEER